MKKSFLTPFAVAMTASPSSGFIQSFQPLPKLCKLILLDNRPDVDSTEAIKEAIAATKKYGPTSDQARLAWDIVEEIDASDSGATLDGSGDKAALQTDREADINAEYDAKMSALKMLLNEQATKVGNLKNIAKEIRVSLLPIFLRILFCRNVSFYDLTNLFVAHITFLNNIK